MDAALAAARFAHYASLMSLFGALVYAGAAVPRRTAAVLAALALASALAWGALVARDMADAPLDLGVLGDVAGTSFGAIWLARLAVLAALLGFVALPDRRWLAPTLAAGAATASLALVGHAAARTGALGLAHRANDAVHLLLSAGWLGGLPLFLVSLAAFARPAERKPALAAMMRFSRLGHYAVAGIFLTGALDVALTTRAFPWPPSSPYRFGLDAKVLIFAAMTALALFNRYLLAPRIGRSVRARSALAAGATAEFALALAAVALVGAFATLDPA